MNNRQQTVVVLGGGPAGLAAAYAAQKAGYRVVIIEKSDIAGGKGGSRTWKDFVVDFGPHAYHAITQGITELVLEHGDGEMIDVPICQRLYVTEHPMTYPLNMVEAVSQFGVWLNLRIVLDYLLIRLKALFVNLPKDSFEQYGIATFGRTLYNVCFGWYSERVWGCSPNTLSVEFARRKLPSVPLARMVLRALTRRTDETPGSYLSVRRYLYHRRGIGRVFQNMADRIVSRGGEILYKTVGTRIQLSPDGRAAQVITDSAGSRAIPADWIVSTVPCDELIDYLSPAIGSMGNVKADLPFRHGVIVNVVVNRERLSDAHWMYLVNSRFYFNRVSEPKNFSPLCAPPDRTLIMFERMCAPDSDMWKWQPEDWRPMVEADLGFFGIRPEEIGEIFLTKMEKAFPFFRVGYEPAKIQMLKELARIPNIVTTGRYGLYLDVDMHDAMVLGMEGFEHLVAGQLTEFYERHESIPIERRTKRTS